MINPNSNLAIVIPYFKLVYFEKTLESLCWQTDSNFNVYIGDDGSLEDPSELIKKHEKRINITYKKFNHIGHKNLVRHWDRCIKMTEGEEWIQILGDDDKISPRFVEEFYNTVESIDAEINLIHFNKKMIDTECEESYFFEDIHQEVITSKELYLNRLRGKRSITLSENVFRRKAYDSNGFIDLPVAFGSDILLILEFSKLGKIFFHKKKLVEVRISPYNLSNIDDKKIEEQRNEGEYLYRLFLLKKYSQNFSLPEKFLILRRIKWIILSKFLNFKGFRQNLEMFNSLVK